MDSAESDAAKESAAGRAFLVDFIHQLEARDDENALSAILVRHASRSPDLFELFLRLARAVYQARTNETYMPEAMEP